MPMPPIRTIKAPRRPPATGTPVPARTSPVPVAVEPLTDRPERFRKGSKLISAIGEIVVRAVRGTADQPILSFEGVTDRTAAERLRGELRVPRERRTGEHLWVDTSDRRFRKRFEDVVRRREEMLATAFRRAGVDVLELDTEMDLVRSVVRFAQMRKQRRARLRAVKVAS